MNTANLQEDYTETSDFLIDFLYRIWDNDLISEKQVEDIKLFIKKKY